MFILIKKAFVYLDGKVNKRIYDQRKKMFDDIVEKSYKFLLYKVSYFINSKYVEDAVHDSILNFYKYHIKKFNMQYKTTTMKRRARNYFLQRFFWYLSNKTFYGNKLNVVIKRTEKELIFSRKYSFFNNILYSSFDGNLNSSNAIKKVKVNIDNVCAEEEKIYLEQFKNYIRKVQIDDRVKDKILVYLMTQDRSIFKTNSSYYICVMRNLRVAFDRMPERAIK